MKMSGYDGQRMWTDLTCDVEFLISGDSRLVKYGAHKAVLSLVSPVFKEQLYGPLSSSARADSYGGYEIVEIGDFSHQTVDNLADIIYGSKEVIPKCNIFELLDLWKITDKYMITSLNKHILKIMSFIDIDAEDNFNLGKLVAKHEGINELEMVCEMLTNKCAEAIEKLKGGKISNNESLRQHEEFDGFSLWREARTRAEMCDSIQLEVKDSDNGVQYVRVHKTLLGLVSSDFREKIYLPTKDEKQDECPVLKIEDFSFKTVDNLVKILYADHSIVTNLDLFELFDIMRISVKYKINIVKTEIAREISTRKISLDNVLAFKTIAMEHRENCAEVCEMIDKKCTEAIELAQKEKKEFEKENEKVKKEIIEAKRQGNEERCSNCLNEGSQCLHNSTIPQSSIRTGIKVTYGSSVGVIVYTLTRDNVTITCLDSFSEKFNVPTIYLTYACKQI